MPTAPRVLAFDTSAQLTSVAVCAGGQLLAEEDATQAGERHAETLLPRIERCLASAGLTLDAIDLFGVGIGPGSFTGVRVGVATAKGFGLALGKPVYPVVSLAALAMGAVEQGEWLVPLLDAFKGEVFGALYRVVDGCALPQMDPFHAAPKEAWRSIAERARAQPLCVFGSGLRRYREQLALPAEVRLLDEAFDAPRARHVAHLALQAAQRGEACDLAKLVPLYLRDSDAQLPKTPLAL